MENILMKLNIEIEADNAAQDISKKGLYHNG
jgi:hypothetical protein